MSVSDFMTKDPVTVGTAHTLASIRELFEVHHFHHVLVTEHRKLIGIISDRDVLKALSPFVGKSDEEIRDSHTMIMRAKILMTRDPMTVSPDAPIIDAVRLMHDKGLSCVPVVDDTGVPLGILTWRDLVRAMLEHSYRKKPKD
ncbi:CBS domain-containing protein [Saccharospirillum mangrovi]|uniref:CBS domain-containing protein n=1 Tax=Saccharospirillum mangrovi TaxID=2161747 RepID=UPI000D3ABD54|nr:CBS domain-containing protein [Saccharospirillum mangrovi]